MSLFRRTVRKRAIVPRCRPGAQGASWPRNWTMMTLTVTPSAPTARTTASAAPTAWRATGRDRRRGDTREEEPPPQRVSRVRVHHVLHHRDPGERGGPHDERREVQEGKIPDVPRAEVEECRQLAARESGQWCGPGISLANTGSGGIGLRSGSHRRAGGTEGKTQMEILK